MPTEKSDPKPLIFFEPYFDTDRDEAGPHAALARVSAELDKTDPDLDAIRDWLSVAGVGLGRRFTVSTVIQKYQQAEVGKPSAEDLRILRELLEGLRQPAACSVSQLREIARKLPASRLDSSDPRERAAGERLRERFENF